MKKSFIKTEKEILKEIEKVLEKNSEKSEKDLLKSIIKAEKIFVSGQGRSGLMVKSFAMRLMQLGFEAYVVGETITPSVAKEDLVISVSGSGKTKTVIDIAQEAKKIGAETVCITAEKPSPLSKTSNLVIILKGKTKESGKSVEPLGSLFEQSTLIFLDAVIIGLMRETGQNEKKMGKKHSSLE